MKILIADDEAVIRLGLRAMLESAGHSVVGTAPNGRQAITLAQQTLPDLAILDIQMPGVTGLEAARQINKQRPTPIVVLTAYSQRELIVEAAAAPVFAYLVKPVKEEMLGPALELACDRFRTWREQQMAVADLRADIEAREIVTKAKFTLMERDGLSERQAFLRIHYASRERRLPMRKIAEEILRV